MPVFAKSEITHYQPSQIIMAQNTPTPTSLPFITLKSSDSIKQVSAFYQKKHADYKLIAQSERYTHLAQKKSTKTGINAYSNIPNIKIFLTPEHNSQQMHTLIQIFHAPIDQRIH
jgi:hypothetical protein